MDSNMLNMVGGQLSDQTESIVLNCTLGKWGKKKLYANE